MSTSVYKEAASIFVKAAQYIQTYGWQETGMSEHGKPRCSMGALTSAQPTPTLDDQLSTIMYEALYSELGGISLTEFNHQANSGLDVIELFTKTANRLNNMT